MVLDGIISSPIKKPGNFSPLVSILQMGLDDYFIFLLSPFFLFDFWVQVVVPSLSALLSYPAWKGFGDIRPVSCPELLNPLIQYLVLFLCPRTFNQIRIQYLLPPVKTLNITSVIKIRCNLFPVSCLFDNVMNNLLLQEY